MAAVGKSQKAAASLAAVDSIIRITESANLATAKVVGLWKMQIDRLRKTDPDNKKITKVCAAWDKLAPTLNPILPIGLQIGRFCIELEQLQKSLEKAAPPNLERTLRKFLDQDEWPQAWNAFVTHCQKYDIPLNDPSLKPLHPYLERISAGLEILVKDELRAKQAPNAWNFFRCMMDSRNLVSPYEAPVEITYPLCELILDNYKDIRPEDRRLFADYTIRYARVFEGYIKYKIERLFEENDYPKLMQFIKTKLREPEHQSFARKCTASCHLNKTKSVKNNYDQTVAEIKLAEERIKEMPDHDSIVDNTYKIEVLSHLARCYLCVSNFARCDEIMDFVRKKGQNTQHRKVRDLAKSFNDGTLVAKGCSLAIIGQLEEGLALVKSIANPEVAIWVKYFIDNQYYNLAVEFGRFLPPEQRKPFVFSLAKAEQILPALLLDGPEGTAIIDLIQTMEVAHQTQVLSEVIHYLTLDYEDYVLNWPLRFVDQIKDQHLQRKYRHKMLMVHQALKSLTEGGPERALQTLLEERVRPVAVDIFTHQRGVDLEIHPREKTMIADLYFLRALHKIANAIENREDLAKLMRVPGFHQVRTALIRYYFNIEPNSDFCLILINSIEERNLTDEHKKIKLRISFEERDLFEPEELDSIYEEWGDLVYQELDRAIDERLAKPEENDAMIYFADCLHGPGELKSYAMQCLYIHFVQNGRPSECNHILRHCEPLAYKGQVFKFLTDDKIDELLEWLQTLDAPMAVGIKATVLIKCIKMDKMAAFDRVLATLLPEDKLLIFSQLLQVLQGNEQRVQAILKRMDSTYFKGLIPHLDLIADDEKREQSYELIIQTLVQRQNKRAALNFLLQRINSNPRKDRLFGEIFRQCMSSGLAGQIRLAYEFAGGLYSPEETAAMTAEFLDTLQNPIAGLIYQKYLAGKPHEAARQIITNIRNQPLHDALNKEWELRQNRKYSAEADILYVRFTKREVLGPYLENFKDSKKLIAYFINKGKLDIVRYLLQNYFANQGERFKLEDYLDVEAQEKTLETIYTESLKDNQLQFAKAISNALPIRVYQAEIEEFEGDTERASQRQKVAFSPVNYGVTPRELELNTFADDFIALE